MIDIDEAHSKAKAILAEAAANIEDIITEEDSKIKIIVRILTEALGWSHKDISAESKNQNGYSDFVLSDQDRDVIVVETKRIGVIGVSTQASKMQRYKISGPALKEATKGIKQAAAYAFPLGIQLAVLTDGVTWIVFLPVTPGARYQDKQAIVFPTIDSILEDFSTFYELLSKAEARRNTYKIIFDQIHENRLVQSMPLIAALSADSIQIQPKSPLAFDLDAVFASFFSNLAGDDDPNLLINCFVETRESRVADFALERITKNVIGNIERSSKTLDEGLQSLIETAIEAGAGQTVFIVGPSGAGKTTFLDRFFKKTLSSIIRTKCIIISINALDATGDYASAIPSMTNQVISLIERSLFDDGIPTWDDLQGLYHAEYLKRARGVDAELYKSDKPSFKIKFGEILERLVEEDREGYLKRLLKDVVTNRKKLPVFIVDNTDEFDLSYREQVFQYFQALSRAAGFCLLIFPVTEKSAWAFSKTEIFNIYSSRSFFLPTPSPREVFRKRVDYLKEKLVSETDDKKDATYFSQKGMRINISDLTAFARIVEDIFVSQDYSSRIVGELSNYNIRKTLGLSKRIVTSAVLGIDDIIKSYIVGGIAVPSEQVFMNALMKGDYSSFKRGDNHEIFPIFEVDAAIRQSPLVNMRILALLKGAHHNASEDIDRHMRIKSIHAFFDLMSFSEVAVDRALVSLIQARLIEKFDPSIGVYTQDQMVAITYSGLAHFSLALNNTVFFEQMALTTKIVSEDVAAKIGGAYKSSLPLRERLMNVRGLFARYLIEEDARFGTVPAREEFSSQRELTERIRVQWEGLAIDVPQDGDGEVLSGAVAVIDWLDAVKGYGFAKVDGLQGGVYLNKRVAQDADVDVYDGDEILCDISRNSHGYYITAIHDVAAAKRTHTGTVISLFEDRDYGFVHVPDLGEDAIFYDRILEPGLRATLREGMTVTIEVLTDKRGRHEARKLVFGPASLG